MQSWKTTIIAFFGVIIAVMNQLTAMWDANPATVADWQSVFPAIIALVGLVFAKDHAKSDPSTGIMQKPQVYPAEVVRV